MDVAIVAARIVADAGTDLIVNPWAQLGATGGLIVMMAVTVRILWKSQVDRIADLTAQRDRAYADLDELNRELRTNVMPTLAQVVRALERFVDAQARRQG